MGQTAAPGTPSTTSVWVEGALFWTAGPSISVPALAGAAFPGLTFKPPSGYEGAAGFDYRWPGQQFWHVVADVRYGHTKTATASASSFAATPFSPFGSPTAILLTTTTAASGTEKESHLVADFMIGRDLGVGSNTPQLQFGIRVADLKASVQVSETGKRTFYSSNIFPGTITTAQSASGIWSTSFFGAGPRLALTGGVPISGFWVFDYSGGLAVLIGDRRSSFTTTSSGALFPGMSALATGSTSTLTAVINADGWAALSYLFTPNVKVSAGIRADFYANPLVNFTGTLQDIDRLYWGPFVRLTGTF